MSASETETIATFGGYLRFLRRRARLTQTELGIAVGYSPGQISMLENGQRSPNLTTIAALFVPILGIEDDLQRRQHLLMLAEKGGIAPSRETSAHVAISETLLVTQEEVGQLESIPWLPNYIVERPDLLEQVGAWFMRDHHVALIGMGGMGKSTLAAQYANLYSRENPVFWMSCVDELALAPETIVRQLALFAATQIAQPTHVIAALRQPIAGDPTLGYSQQLAMVANALRELAAPLFVFDDAQVINQVPQVQQFIRQLMARVPSCRMLFVSREELSFPNVAHIPLQGLHSTELAILHSRIAPAMQIDMQQLYQQTGGSPMLVRLALSYWQQHGLAHHADTLVPIANYLIDSILNTLPESARRLLDLLAIWSGPLNATLALVAEQIVSEWPAYDHQQSLRSLQRMRLIEQVQAALPHPLLREPLLLALRTQPAYTQRLHQLAAEIGLRMHEPLRAAHHRVQSGDLEQAYALILEQPHTYLPLAQGVKFAAVIEELLVLLERQQHGRSQRWKEATFTLLMLRGDLLAHTTATDQAQASYYEALNHAKDVVKRTRVAEKIAIGAYRRGAFEEALILCEQAIKTLGKHVSKEGITLRIEIEITRIRVLIALARVDEARQLCEAALAQVRPFALVLPSLAAAVRTYANLILGYIARLQGIQTEARHYLTKCLKQAHIIHAGDVEIDALQYLSATMRDLGEMAEAEEQGQQALQLAHAAGNEYQMSNILHHLSLTDYFHADLDRALWRTERVLQLKVPMGDIDGIVASRMVQAIVQVARGEIQAAHAAATQAGRDCDLLENTWLRGIADYGHAIVLSVTGDLAAAEYYLKRSLATEMLKMDVPFYTGAHMYLAMVYAAQGRLGEAEAIIAPALPVGAGYSAELLRELVRAIWLLGHDQRDAAHQCALQLIERSKTTGFLIYAQEGTRLLNLTAHPPPLADMPRLVCCPDCTPTLATRQPMPGSHVAQSTADVLVGSA